MAEKKHEITVDVDTLEDFLMVCHNKAVSDASAKHTRVVPPRQIGELYPEYHRRIMQQLQEEAVACQEYVAQEDRIARAAGKVKFDDKL